MKIRLVEIMLYCCNYQIIAECHKHVSLKTNVTIIGEGVIVDIAKGRDNDHSGAIVVKAQVHRQV
jgi:hypothetical protein